MDLFSLCYSYDNKNNTFTNSGNNGHGLKNVTCKQTFKHAFITLLRNICFASILTHARMKSNIESTLINKFIWAKFLETHVTK